MIDGMKCIDRFPDMRKLHDGEMERIRLSGKKVLNSGIRV